MLIQVKADEFVGYDGIAQHLCQASLSLTLYPPGMKCLMKLALTARAHGTFLRHALRLESM